ncbi:cortical protein KAR9-domain-containing protein [Talaromyces proteolyticus]|uniref:Cortical protein KAR9-domain-containing protein n=1 Tax=Talaromyces proteolyticus TaxID=1131652 RepID=A0AAD4KZK5_9EURO|nr:cortical protein KAR9-domain-containing protein [Talaromyces proteolyticus]KAH8704807.1 cortical protein KAR9-domain-containing protein [Talaromyces proteolyticus]
MPATPGASPATTITTTTTTTPTPSVSLKSLTKKFSAPQLSRSSSASSLKTTPPSASTSQSLTPTPRRLKASPSPTAQKISKKDTDQDESARASIFRRLSPGLAARLKLLNGSSEQLVHAAPGPGPGPKGVGRIPEDKLQELDSLHRDLSIKVERRGRIWGGAQIKRERSAPDLLQSPTKTGTGIGTGIEIEKELPLQPHPSVFDQPEQSVTIHIDSSPDSGPDSPAAAAPMTAVGVAVEPAMDQSTDLEEYLRRSTQDQDQAPAPPPKDTPPAPSTPSSNVQSYFSPLGLNRTESIFSFSRASFSSQLSQLTSINLPQPTALESSISSIINAPAAVRALIGAAEQIQKWMNKASEVLNGMEAEDDVEWAAAGGREGLDDVDKAVITFESLVDVYVKAIENVQLRDDIDDVRKEDLTLIVAQMESTLKNWANIRHALQGVKEQVELAMEWEELWNNVLGDVGLELDNLSRLIFEMEEGRHKSLVDPETEQGNGLDINELETIVEESPSHGTPSSSKRLSLALFPSSAPQAAAGSSNPHDDANLMQLFARMQPLRASLDFLPMRLSMFQARAERMFPTACQELDDKRKRLETSYKKLEGDAEALRRELGEDRWILVFRNAGKQAQKMCDSVERSISKLQESLEANDPVNNPTAITKKIESYEAKKIHYIPAIGRVMSIIQKGVNDRLTVNGEVLTLLSDMQQRVDALKTSMKVMDSILEETTISKSQQLRDSISSIITDSPANTSLIGTPGSSPASSVIMMTNGSLRTPNAGGSGSSRRGSSVGSASRSVTGRRLSGIPTSSQRKSSAPLSYNSPTSSTLTPSPAPRVRRPSTNTAASNKPRWNSSTNTNDLDTGHNFQPLSVTSPSAYAKNRNSRSISSSLPIPSPLSRATSSSPVPRTASRVGSRLGLRPSSRLGAASPTSPLTPIPSGTASKIRSSTNIPTGLRNRQSYAGTTRPYDDSPSKATRPGTALGMGTSSRRISLLPQPRSSKTGRDSAAGNRSSSRMDDRPRWR